VIDLRLIRDEPEVVRASQRARGASDSVVDDLLRADGERRGAVQRFEALRAEQKQLGKQVSNASGDARAALLSRTRELSVGVKAAETAVSAADQALRRAQLAIPNVIEDGAPHGGEDNYVVPRGGGPRARPTLRCAITRTWARAWAPSTSSGARRSRAAGSTT
jgi:seryl-tRNA synthetase